MSQRWFLTLRKLTATLAVLGVAAACFATPALAADSPANAQPVYFGFKSGNAAVFAEVVNQKAIVVFSCVGSIEVQVNDAYSDSWNTRFRRPGLPNNYSEMVVSRSQFRLFAGVNGFGSGAATCTPVTGSVQPVASREEAIQKSGINLAAINEYKTYYAQAYGQQFIAASSVVQAAPPAALAADSSSKVQTVYFGFKSGQ